MRSRAILHGLVALGILVTETLAQPSQHPFRYVEEPIDPNAPSIVAAGDIDGDGDVDLILATAPGALINDGHGRFVAATYSVLFSASVGPNIPPVMSTPPAIAADFNLDGIDDVLTRDGLFLSQSGGLHALAPTPAGTAVALRMQFAAGDVEGDGDLDVFVSSVIPSSHGLLPAALELWINAGNGVFASAPAQLPATTTRLDHIVLADIDGDGDRDLVLSPSSSAYFVPLARRVLLNNGAGLFLAGPALPGSISYFTADMISADVNGDGLVDLVLTNTPPAAWLEILVNQGGGAFLVASDGTTANDPVVPAAVDLDGDGRDEILLVSWITTTVHRLTTAGTVVQIATLPSHGTAVITADFDGDADRDVVVSSWSAIYPQSRLPQSLLLNDAAGALVPMTGRLTLSGYSNVAVTGDVDADGDADLVCGNGVGVAKNDGSGVLRWDPGFGVPAGAPPSMTFTRLTAIDADQDGDMDLVVTNGQGVTSAIPDQILLSTGTGWLAGVTLGGSTGVTGVLRVGDVDADGDADILVRRGATIELIANLGGGAWSTPTAVPGTALSGFAFDFVLADMDNDGDVDFVGVYSYGGTRVLSNGGAGTFTLTASLPALIGTAVRVGDLDGDGLLDIFVGGSYARNLGGVAFAPPVSLPNGVSPTALVDVDADGDLDLLGASGLLYMNLGATIGPAINLQRSLALNIPHADFDRDGDEDLVADGPIIFTNTTRQLAARSPPRIGRPASLEIWGPSGGSYALFASSGLANVPLPGYGLALIDPASALLVTSGALGPTGQATFVAGVPLNFALVGQSLPWQALVGGPGGARLTGRVVSTIGGY